MEAESMAHSQKKKKEKEKETYSIPEKAQALGLLEEEFKSAFLNILKELKEIIDKEEKEARRSMFKQIDNIDKEVVIF